MAKTTKQPVASSKPSKLYKKTEQKPAKAVVKKPVKKAIAPLKKAVVPIKKAVTTVKKTAAPVKKATAPVKKATAPVKKVPVIKAAPKEAPKTKAKAKEKVHAPVKAKEEVKKKVHKAASEDLGEVSVEKKLIALFTLQQIDTQVDKIRIIRGELPLEVQDLEDEIAGLETRIDNYVQETHAFEKAVADKKLAIKESHALIKKYEEQQKNVRNNREYDSLSKEIEYQNLEIQLAEKRIRENQAAVEVKKDEIEQFQKELKDRKNDLDVKKNELDDIVAETEKEENELIKRSGQNRKVVEDRLITAYTRIRKNARNGLAVVQIERDACGGCFNKIPPQHQLDIRMHKKIIVCEYCGRILVDDGIVSMVN
jgi:predicted  nucleic acid-binding Zn-ribbon protein